MTLLLVIVGIAVVLGIGAYGYLWYLAKHSPSIIREGDVKDAENE